MSKVTKRNKHVKKEVIDDYYEPEGDETIVRVVASKGNNLHEVESSDRQRFLVSMPNKFRKNVWIKRGNFVVIEPVKEGNKVQAEIVYILYPKQIKYLQTESLWPQEFEKETAKADSKQAEENAILIEPQSEIKKVGNPSYSLEEEDLSCSEEEDSDDGDELFANPNHRPVVYFSEDETTSEEEEGEEEDEAGADESAEEKDEQEDERSSEEESDDEKMEERDLNANKRIVEDLSALRVVWNSLKHEAVLGHVP